MRNSDSPYLADLFAISLRWLALFGLTISLGSTGGLALGARGSLIPLPLIILSLPALWNGFVSAMAIVNRRFYWHRQINVALDILFSLAIFIVAGGLSSGVFWVALLPLFSAAIYFEARGALVVAVLISLFQAGYTYLVSSQHFNMMTVGIMTGFNTITGSIVAVSSTPLVRRLRSSYQSTMNQRRESEWKAQRQEHDRMRALFSLIETLSATLNYQTVLETVLDSAIAALGERGGTADGLIGSVLLFGNNQTLEIKAARGFISRDSAIALPAEKGALRETLQHGGIHLLEMPGEDPELGKLATMQKQGSALCLPLIRAMNAYGVVLFAHASHNFFTPERVETLQMLSNQAIIALQNASLYQDLAREKERIVQTQEEAQKKLARDLHDGPTQSVAAIAMRIEIARKMLEKSAKLEGVKEAAEELTRIEDLARRTTQEIRHMLFTLRPLVLESEGLEAALQAIAEKVFELYQQNVVIDADPYAIQQMDATRQSVVFYLVEEAVNNARKHAEAAEIRVRIKFPPNEDCIVVLEILDNGKGFDVGSIMNSYDRRGSLGMINLRERADLVNGVLKIDSVEGKGTRILVLLPLTEDAADRLNRLR
jgi:signal transduction histidine kinase